LFTNLRVEEGNTISLFDNNDRYRERPYAELTFKMCKGEVTRASEGGTIAILYGTGCNRLHAKSPVAELKFQNGWSGGVGTQATITTSSQGGQSMNGKLVVIQYVSIA
jgi:hypothetical protein